MRDLAVPMAETATPVSVDTSEFELSGLTPLASHVVAPPRVAESAVHFECRLTDLHRLRRRMEQCSRPGLYWARSLRSIFGKIVSEWCFSYFRCRYHFESRRSGLCSDLARESSCCRQVQSVPLEDGWSREESHRRSSQVIAASPVQRPPLGMVPPLFQTTPPLHRGK